MADNELTPELIAFISEQKDRQEIYDCLVRFARGLDRHDKELMVSAYHPDAYDEHGFQEGNPSDFCDWALAVHTELTPNHQHIIGNFSIDLEGSTAHTETYWTSWGVYQDGGLQLNFGRYIDRFEKRRGKWAIAYRVCITETSGMLGATELPEDIAGEFRATGPSCWGKEDLSYVRPLTGSVIPD